MLTNAEIKLAAESIACTGFESGNSEDQIIRDIDRAFVMDPVPAGTLAREYAQGWLEEMTEVVS